MRNIPLEDTSLLSAIQKGDRSAFDVLFQKYYSVLCKAVDQPCDGGLAASAPAAEQDALSVRNRQIDVPRASRA